MASHCSIWQEAAEIWSTDGSAIKSRNDGTIDWSGAYCRGSSRIAPCSDGLTSLHLRAWALVPFEQCYAICKVMLATGPFLQIVHTQCRPSAIKWAISSMMCLQLIRLMRYLQNDG